MRAYTIRRLLLIVPTLFVLTILVFLSVRFLPGDVIDAMRSRLETAGGYAEIDRVAVERILGLDVPVHVQYGRWIGVLPTPDFVTNESHFNGILQGVAGQRRIPQPANQHFRSAPSDDAGVVGKSGAGGHRVGVLLDESASCRYGCLRLPCAPGGPPSYHFAWWDAPQEATWRSRTPGGRYGRLIPRFGPLRCTPCGP